MASEIKLTLTGYRTSERLPEESGNYLCCTDLCSNGRPYWAFLPYSAKYEKFNATDAPDGDEHAMAMDYWFPVPATIAEIEKGAVEDD